MQRQVLWMVLSLGSVLMSCQVSGQRYEVIDHREAYDSNYIQLTTTIQVPTEDAGYTLILPDQPPAGMVISFNSGRDTSHQGFEMRLYHPVLKAGLAKLFVTTGNRFEFLFEEKRMAQLHRYISQVLRQHQIPPDKLLFVGMSLAGTRALKFSQWCMSADLEQELQPRAIAICDAPLDFVRFWQQGNLAMEYGSSAVAANEATWVNAQLEIFLGGPPSRRTR